MNCEGKTYSGRPCIYRSTCNETKLCGVHKFAGDNLEDMQKVLPFMFIKPIHSSIKS